MQRTPFVGRTRELQNLELLLTKRSASMVVVRGRRRIGKSRLIAHFAKGKRFLKFTGLPPTEGTSAQTQRATFIKQLCKQTGLPPFTMDDWEDLFSLLAQQTKDQRVIILLDEISWMGHKDPTFLGKLKNAWDLELSKNPELIFILCGSVSTWIEKNLISSTGFFGRFSLYMTLEELPLVDCKTLLAQQGVKTSSSEIFKILSVTGGVPWYLEHIQGHLHADENIKNLCFKPEGILFNEFNLIFHDLFNSLTPMYKNIVQILAKGSKCFSDICNLLNYAKSGIMSKYLDNLINAGFVTRDYTWNLKDGKLARLSHFRLADNYIRFYLKYIDPRRLQIKNNGFEEISLASLPQWDAIMGLQFENLVLKNRKIIHKALNLKAEDILADNPFFQRKSVRQKGCQIDYLIHTRFNTMFVCEVKFSRGEIGPEIIRKMHEKIARIHRPKGFACWPVLVHVNGVHEKVSNCEDFAAIIDFSDFL
ncbi:MAG: ATP-binding protein [Pseudomonadota bacterium]